MCESFFSRTIGGKVDEISSIVWLTIVIVDETIVDDVDVTTRLDESEDDNVEACDDIAVVVVVVVGTTIGYDKSKYQ
jgi:hypothetical protein